MAHTATPATPKSKTVYCENWSWIIQGAIDNVGRILQASNLASTTV